MAFLEWLLELAILFFVFRVLPRMIFGGSRGGSRPTRTKPAGGGERAGGALVRDPQCGTFVPETRSITIGSGVGALHFCSAACRDAWIAAHAGARTAAR